MNKKIMYITISIFLVILVLFSSTYALLFKSDETDKQSYATGMLEITSETTNNSVTLSNNLPMSDSDGANTTPYTFKITNIGNLSYKFNVMLLSTTTSNQIESQYIKIKVNDNIPVKLSDLTNGIILSDITLKPGKSIEVSLRVWLDENTPNTEIGKSFNAKVTTEGEAVYNSKASSTLENLGLTESIGTPDFSKTSCSDGCGESTVGIYQAEDDFGDTYYFRGDVENNYVYFAGFYWRIIRINGDGSIRMIYDGTSAYDNGDTSSSYNRRIGYSDFNENSGDNAYVGYMYGTTRASTYAATHANTNDSTIKTAIDTWYNDNIKNTDNEQYVVDTIYCNDRELSSGTGRGTTETYYKAYERLYTNKTPTLKCNQENDRFTINSAVEGVTGNGALTNPIGLITADEVAYAGGVYNVENSKHYLYIGDQYWTMSPIQFYVANGTTAREFFVGSNGGGLYSVNVDGMRPFNNTLTHYNYGARPVISISGSALQSGTGTMNDPFRLQDANSPDLVQGLIPVVYDESTSNWVKADSTNANNSWYNYNEKKWANAVLVSQKSPTEDITTDVSVNLVSATYTSSINSDTSNSFPQGATIVGYSSFELDSVNGVYKMGTKQVQLPINADNYNDLVGYYVCLRNCTSVFYVEAFKEKTYFPGQGGWYNYWYTGKKYTASLSDNAITKYVSTSYTMNSDGTFTLNSPTKKSYSSDIVNYYTCDSETQYTCSTMYKIKTATTNNVTKADKYVVGSIYSPTSKYSNASVGTTIEMDDISAFYVWIPRYKYKVWNINKVVGTDSYDAYNTGIEIMWEKDKESTGTINCTYSYAEPSSSAGSPNESCTGSNGDYYTHPAFTFGSDEVRGFWIGKFELTGSSSQLTILPNKTSLRSNTLGSFNTMIQNMQVSNNIYGLSTSRVNTNSHMLTNYEWGAVAYLTNSKYGNCTDGVCTEMLKNGYGDSTNTTRTGCGPIESDSNTGYGLTCNSYDTSIGKKASTTGNITGVYDMSGGSYEYIMGNMSSGANNYTFNPGKSSMLSDWYINDNSKYLVTYANGSTYNDQLAYNRGRLGDATTESMLTISSSGGWYADYAAFVYSNSVWFTRGGCFADNTNAGIFYFGSSSGAEYVRSSSRAALVSLSS